MKKNLRGYTLIELAVVIMILCVIGGTIAPHFTDLKTDAELSQVKGTAAALQASVKSVQMKFIIQGRDSSTQNLPGVGQDNVDTNAAGFPIGINKNNGNQKIGQGKGGCVGIWNGILNTSLIATTSSTGDYQVYRHTGNRVCSYVYREGGDTANRSLANLVIQYDSRDGKVVACGAHSQLNACTL